MSLTFANNELCRKPNLVQRTGQPYPKTYLFKYVFQRSKICALYSQVDKKTYVNKKKSQLGALAVEYKTRVSQFGFGKSGLVQEIELENDYPPLHVKAAGKVYAMGDLHGDMAKTLGCFKMAGLMQLGEDNKPVWTGGDSVVVQLGDVLDRGDNEISIILLLKELDRQARQQNGAVYMINGNHESLNVCNDYRYVTMGAFLECAAYYGYRNGEEFLPKNQRHARNELYRPGGYMASILAENPTVLVVNDTLFAHGGVLPLHIDYGLARLNQEVCSWMRGERSMDGGMSPPPFLAMGDQTSVMWNRTYSKEQLSCSNYTKAQICQMLRRVLDSCGAKRMVVGHTPQLRGCNAECDGMVWRLDVGMSGGVFDACATVLEIAKEQNGETLTKVKTSGALCLDQISLEHLYR